MDVKILGPFEAQIGDIDILPTAAKVRQVLAVLALQPGRVVSARTLAEELWDESPRSAATTLQTYIMQLRRRISAAYEQVDPSRSAKSVLVTRHLGYALEIDPADVDAVEFARLSQAGQNALDAGDLERASTLLNRALQLWRGDPLLDLTAGGQLSIEVLRLRELWQTTLECRIDVDLAVGRYHHVLAELATLVARDPMNEGLCERYMLALNHVGRRNQALTVFRSLRRCLVDELGVEPSGRLHQLQMRILNDEDRRVEPQSGGAFGPVQSAGAQSRALHLAS